MRPISEKEELELASWQRGEGPFPGDRPDKVVITQADEWGILLDMCDESLGDHQFDEPFFMLKETVKDLQEKKQHLLSSLTDEGTYEETEASGIYEDLKRDLHNFEINERVQEAETLLRKNIRFMQRFEGLQNKQEITEEKIMYARQFPLEEMLDRVWRDGNRKKALCPLHKENTPSLVIYPGNTWYCFGCHQGGDSIDLVMQLEDIPFYQAVRRLQ